MNRRHFLKSSSATLALPFLECMTPASHAADTASPNPTRFVGINIGLGLHSPNLIPSQPGSDYPLTPYLQPIAQLRNRFTVISGTSHPGVDGGHSAERSFLTAAPHPGSPSFKNSISLDQLAAEQLGAETRYAYLATALSSRSLSWSRAGVEIPSETSPARLFDKLFLEGNPGEKAAQLQRIQDGQSIMDTVQDQARSMARTVSAQDREKLDQYFTAVRETEKRLVKAEAWSHKPKPVVDTQAPQDNNDRTDVIGKGRLMYDIIHLALMTDSSRLITFFKNGTNLVPPIQGITQDYHNLSHHGKDPEKIEELAIIETAQMQLFADFLTKLQNTDENGTPLLDHTMVLLGSNLGDASSHNNRNMPIVLAGGSFQHGQHLAFDRTNNEALPKLYVNILQKLGLDTDSFAHTTGTLPGLA
jgi:hypothetical protein